MKKYIKILKYSILPLILASTITLIPLGMVSCSSNQVFSANTYTTEIEDIKKLTINVKDRNVIINPTKDNKISISYFYSSEEYYSITKSQNNELSISSAYNYDITNYFGTKTPVEYRHVNISIPNDILLDLSVTTTNAIINCNNVSTINSIVFNSNGGDLNFNQLNAGNSIDLTVKNSNIIGNIIGSYEMYAITCDIKKGNSNLPNRKPEGSKELNVNCNNGDVKIEFSSTI